MSTNSKEQATELEYLKFFFQQASYSFGPADSDIYRGIAEDFERKTGKSLPKGYGREEDECDHNMETWEGGTGRQCTKCYLFID